MARELLLAQSSDWAFIMKTGSHTSYANKRVTEHICRFTKLWQQVNNGNIDEKYLSYLEYKDNVFPDMNFRIYLEEKEAVKV